MCKKCISTVIGSCLFDVSNPIFLGQARTLRVLKGIKVGKQALNTYNSSTLDHTTI